MFRWTKWPPEFTCSATPTFPTDFPNLRPESCANDISGATGDYNCIAWAAHLTTDWWEPDIFLQYHWPDGVPREYTVAAFVAAYKTVGFEECHNPTVEAGMEKIAIFARTGYPTHAARLLPSGLWTSKLGTYEDIEHETLDSVSGPLYGDPRVYMKRKVA